MVKAGVIYDSQADSLLVYREEKKGSFSIDLGEIIITLDKDMHITAVEILNPDILYNISKQDLEKVVGADIQINERQPIIWICISLQLKNQKTLETLRVPLSLERAITV